MIGFRSSGFCAAWLLKEHPKASDETIGAVWRMTYVY